MISGNGWSILAGDAVPLGCVAGATVLVVRGHHWAYFASLLTVGVLAWLVRRL